MAQLVIVEDLGNLEANTPIREHVGLGCVDLPGIMMAPRKRCRVAAPDGDYMQLATLDGSLAYLEPRTKELRTKMRSTLYFSVLNRCQAKESQPQQAPSTEHCK
jgi:acyl carrier protein